MLDVQSRLSVRNKQREEVFTVGHGNERRTARIIVRQSHIGLAFVRPLYYSILSSQTVADKRVCKVFASKLRINAFVVVNDVQFHHI